MSARRDRLFLARIGRPFGVRGLLKLKIASDFHEFFSISRRLILVLNGENGENGEESTLTIDRFDGDRALIGFEGYDAPETAAKLTNGELFTTIAETKEAVKLAENERFVFELIGAKVLENGEEIAVIEDISGDDPPLLALRSIDGKKRLAVGFVDRFFIGFEGGSVKAQNIRELFEAI